MRARSGAPASRLPARRRALPLLLLASSLLSLAGAPAGAQPTNTRAGGDEPIEINADRLVVEQNQQIATFIGNVDAVQGTMKLRADELRVFYVQAEGQQQAAGQNQSIRRIEAQGNVLLTQPNETAAGDAGVYDPIAGKLTLEGNVVLTQGRNVVRGTKLVSDLNTGVSTVSSSAPVAGKRGERVRALFTPEKKKEP
jgi:lipopolysaccharide export system protein LptA